jgi:hypothetical protein
MKRTLPHALRGHRGSGVTNDEASGQHARHGKKLRFTGLAVHAKNIPIALAEGSRRDSFHPAGGGRRSSGGTLEWRHFGKAPAIPFRCACALGERGRNLRGGHALLIACGGGERQRRSSIQPRVGGPAAYPGKSPECAQPQRGCIDRSARIQPRWGWGSSFPGPRVAAPASCQPWAGRSNAVGVQMPRKMHDTLQPTKEPLNNALEEPRRTRRARRFPQPTIDAPVFTLNLQTGVGFLTQRCKGCDSESVQLEEQKGRGKAARKERLVPPAQPAERGQLYTLETFRNGRSRNPNITGT